MRVSVLLLGLALLTAAGAPAQQLQRRPMTVDDALDMARITTTLMSPDGESVFYTRVDYDWDEGTTRTDHLMVSSRGGEPRRFVGEEGGSGIRFSPSGEFLSLKRAVDGVPQIFLLRTGGGEAFQLSRHENAIGDYEWSGDSRKLFFVAPEPLTAEQQRERDLGSDAVFVNEGPDSKVAGRWTNLWVVDIESGEEARLTHEDFHLLEIEPDAIGSRVLIVARYSSDENDIDHNEIYLVHVSDGTIERITDNGAVEDSVTWSPDGQSVVYKADDEVGWTAKRDKLWMVDLASRETRLLTERFEMGRISRYFWSPDGRFLRFGALRRTDHNLFELELATGSVRPLTDVSGNLVVHGLSADHRRMVYTFDDHDTPPDLHASSVGVDDPVRLTELNPWIEREIELASMEVVRWTSNDDLEIEGLVHLPRSYESGSRLPLMLHIHGGPAGFWWNTFSAPHQIYAGLGYASLSPNIRGSDGYTDDLREANTHYRGDGIGKGDFADLMTGLDYVVERGWADPDRIGVRGWSYGAILGAYSLTQTDRFKAASLGAGVYDWSAEFSLGYHWDVTRWYIGGTPWTNRDAWLDQSALTHVEDIRTPLMLHHGMEDVTTTAPQSMLLYGAMTELGNAPVRHIRYPREPHGFREPRHNRIRIVEEVRWMQQHVRGVEWVPWKRSSPPAPSP